MTLKNTDVKITLTTVQRAENTEKYTVTLDGTLSLKNGTYFIKYTDTEPNIIAIKPDCVHISKPQSNSVLTFEQGREHVSGYMTPVGKMSVSVFTHKLLNAFETERRIFIKYRLVFNESAEAENDITIKIQEK